MSNSVIWRGGRASTLDPLLPRFVTTKPAFESLESDFRTKVGSALTLSARVADETSAPWSKPRTAMMCAATANWTLFTDMRCLPPICDVNNHIWSQVFCKEANRVPGEERSIVQRIMLGINRSFGFTPAPETPARRFYHRDKTAHVHRVPKRFSVRAS